MISIEEADRWFATYDPDGECERAGRETARLRQLLQKAEDAERAALVRAQVRYLRASGNWMVDVLVLD